jgi:hypothetical protein
MAKEYCPSSSTVARPQNQRVRTTGALRFLLEKGWGRTQKDVKRLPDAAQGRQLFGLSGLSPVELLHYVVAFVALEGPNFRTVVFKAVWRATHQRCCTTALVTIDGVDGLRRCVVQRSALVNETEAMPDGHH